MTKVLFTHNKKFKPDSIKYFFIQNKNYFYNFYLEKPENKDTSPGTRNELSKIVLDCSWEDQQENPSVS